MTTFTSVHGTGNCEAFEYTGPFTEYPAWAQELLQIDKLRVTGAYGLTARLGTGSAGYASENDHVPVRAGMWVQLLDFQGHYQAIRVLSLDELRRDWLPVADISDDVLDSYFKSGVEDRKVIRQVPMSYLTFQWTGHVYEAPRWFHRVLEHKGLLVQDRCISGLGFGKVVPGDWILTRMGDYSHTFRLTDEEYKKEFP